MFKVIIHWVYYKDGWWFASFNARVKKNCVFFYDYDNYVGCILNHLSESALDRLRLNIFKKYHYLIKFTKFWECDNNDNYFQGYKIDSPIFDVSMNDLACMLDVSDRKKYFDWDDVKEKYYLKGGFINYVNLNVV